MLRHPSRRYIYYLMSKRSLDVGAIVLRLGEFFLPVPQTGSVLNVFLKTLRIERGRMVFPPGFNPVAKTMTSATIDFLDDWKIAGMWRGDPFVKRAQEIIVEPRIRRTLDVLLLGPLTAGAIANRMRRLYALSDAAMNPQVIRAYSHYFWDVDALPVEGWNEILQNWMPKGNYSDYFMSMQAPRSTVGAALSVAAAERSMETLTQIETYEAIRAVAFRDIMEVALTHKTGMSKSQAMASSLLSFKIACEELDKKRGASAEMVDQFRRIQTVQDTSRIATIHDLPVMRAPAPPPAALEAPIFEDEPEKEPHDG